MYLAPRRRLPLTLSGLERASPFAKVSANCIRRASTQRLPPRPADMKASAASGSTHYGAQCGACHGPDGRSQMPIGRWMYPRAADLTSDQVQSFSDQELFWIIQNGIRFTGMPGFGKVYTDDGIWNLVDYVRTLP